ncbi:hypothetical protein PFICI_01036 [Pestalotiopsis fici W106-1]|uniref:Uncharacterized protein n=1 Tax=Pestalotiopsis fici (strain W106-1 / CGMCC3.15140) TaxID=1229662 RepID=W3XME0_PESFW|nr:uncharacterized protein PFICI_01036 [Pestalotiopsis fici W106-1]ETS87208.1 hypothetical protein PFICI_01036 [Pestalotiopsis fici W106-1]
MANNVFYFFYAPTWDWPPEGPIKLGNVIRAVGEPEQPLFTAPLPAASEVFTSEKFNVEYTKEKLREGRFSILTKFLSILGVGINVGADWQDSNAELYGFKSVETTQFIPKEDYIQKCIEADAVRLYLDRSRYRKPVYIITGIKTVYGARAKSYKHKQHGGEVGIAVDGTIWSGGTAPLSVEPGVGGKRVTTTETTWEGSSDFVFAFRVHKIHVNRKTQAVDESHDYTKGALLDSKTDKIRDALPDIFILSQEDPKPSDENHDEGEFTEGDRVVLCAIPRVTATDEEEM